MSRPYVCLSFDQDDEGESTLTKGCIINKITKSIKMVKIHDNQGPNLTFTCSSLGVVFLGLGLHKHANDA